MTEARPIVSARAESLLPVLVLLGGFALWEALSRAGVLSTLFFPAPSVVAATLVKLARSGSLGKHVGATLYRVILGFSIGGAAGLVVGLFMGWSRRIRLLLDPFVAILHPVPKISLLPLIMIALGIGETSKVAVVAVAAFFPMLVNTMTGVRQISPVYFEVADNYGAGRARTFWRVILPGSLPMALAGARIALNIALTLTIAVEIATAQRGLGAMVWLGWQTLRTEEVLASVFVTAAIGFSGSSLLVVLARRLAPWQTERPR